LNTTHDQLLLLCQKLDQAALYQYTIEDSADFENFVNQNQQFWGVVDESLQDHYRSICRITVYIENNEQAQKEIEMIKEVTGETVTVIEMPEEDWENSWKDNYPIQPVGDRFEIVPVWLEPSSSRIPVIIDPGLTFGTGYHPTTQLCLTAMEKMDLSKKSILDIGCGSGILSIAALRLGAEHCTGCDIDESTPRIAMLNASYNGYSESQFSVYQGNILTDRILQNRLGEDYDLILANIVADVILPLLDQIRTFLSDHGTIILSGIQTDRIGEIKEKLSSIGLKILSHSNIEEWNAFVCEPE